MKFSVYQVVLLVREKKFSIMKLSRKLRKVFYKNQLYKLGKTTHFYTVTVYSYNYQRNRIFLNFDYD